MDLNNIVVYHKILYTLDSVDSNEEAFAKQLIGELDPSSFGHLKSELKKRNRFLALSLVSAIEVMIENAEFKAGFHEALLELIDARTAIRHFEDLQAEIDSWFTNEQKLILSCVSFLNAAAKYLQLDKIVRDNPSFSPKNYDENDFDGFLLGFVIDIIKYMFNQVQNIRVLNQIVNWEETLFHVLDFSNDQSECNQYKIFLMLKTIESNYRVDKYQLFLFKDDFFTVFFTIASSMFNFRTEDEDRVFIKQSIMNKAMLFSKIPNLSHYSILFQEYEFISVVLNNINNLNYKFFDSWVEFFLPNNVRMIDLHLVESEDHEDNDL